ncbi:hypothetical protein PENSPDRAFT_751814 [Peniophora sp. CONT]|nr:hypothetical protein PENSPDRAFT_751814 [Peniophora sp. CONT]
MSTPTARAAHGSGESQKHVANLSRLVINKKFSEHAKGAVVTALTLLSIAAQMSQGVPYLGAISTALQAFLKVHDEVEQCKDECKAAMDDAQQIASLIIKFRDRCIASGKGDSALTVTVREAFTELESILLRCITTLQKCRVDSQRKRDRLRLYWKRADLLKSVKKCAADMGKALQRFDRTLNIDIAFVLEGIDVKVDNIRATLQSPITPQEIIASSITPTWRLRAAPHIFFGRESEVQLAIDLIVHQAPARVAILGAGGIGKTSIALSVLHHPDVEALYQGRRCFVSCEAATSADGVIRALAEAIHFDVPGNLSAASVQHGLLHHLNSVAGIICLDNLETPWDADTVAMEDLVAELSMLPSIALLITSRVIDTPLIGWSEPQLPPIMPLRLEAALQTWDAICHGHDDYAVKLVEAVDCVPLAVTLLARLARTETTSNIWGRWANERTDVIRSQGTEHRLNNLGVSIEVSLRTLSDHASVDVLSILSIFPNGLCDEDISVLENALQDRFSVRCAITSLKQFSLVYTESSAEWTRNPQYYTVRALSPIRHHMLRYHPISNELFLRLASLPIEFYEWRLDTYLMSGWDRGELCRARCMSMLAANTHMARNVELLSRATEMSCELPPELQSKLHQRLSYVLVHRGEYEKARCALLMAVKLDEQLKDRDALFRDWSLWLYAFRYEFWGREDECGYLDEVQGVIKAAWDLGCDNSRAWVQDFNCYDWLALAQHCVNEGRRKLQRPIGHRSGLYSDNDSTVFLGYSEVEASYHRLVETSRPPWELSVILGSSAA